MCPECGQAIVLAFREKLLRYADPAWVRTIRLGVRFELAWVLLLPLVFIMNLIPQKYSAIAVLAICLLFSVASVFLTVSEFSSDSRISFLALRIFTTVGFLGSLGWFLAHTSFRASIPELPCMIASLSLAPAFFLKLDILRNYARRLISWDDAASFSLVIWMGGLAVLAVVTLSLVIFFSVYVGFFVLIAVIFILVLVVWGTYLNAIVKLNVSMSRELGAARRGIRDSI